MNAATVPARIAAWLLRNFCGSAYQCECCGTWRAGYPSVICVPGEPDEANCPACFRAWRDGDPDGRRAGR